MTLFLEASTLIERHTRTYRDPVTRRELRGTEPPLLVLLQDAVTGSGQFDAESPGSSATSPGTPGDLTTIELLREIRLSTEKEWPGRTDPGFVRIPLINKLRYWTGHAHRGTEADQETLRLKFAGWNGRIREIFEPTKAVPLRGVACPWCTRCGTELGNLSTHPVLTLYPRLDTPAVQCALCDSCWYGSEIMDLVPDNPLACFLREQALR